MARAPIGQRQFSSAQPLPDFQARQREQTLFQQRQDDIQTAKDLLAESRTSGTGTSLQSLMGDQRFLDLAARSPEIANNIQKLGEAQSLQRLSNLGQASFTMQESLRGIEDPKQKKKILNDMIQMRKQFLPTMGFGTEDTEELEKTLNEQGLEAALDEIDTTVRTAESMGFALPKPTTLDIKSTRVGKSVTPGIGDREIFYLTPQGLIASGLAAPDPSGGISVSVGGADFTKDVFKDLYEERKNTQRTIEDIYRVQKMIDKLGPQSIGSLGGSGTIAKGLTETIQTIGNTARNLGLGSDVDDPNTRLTSVLQGTNLYNAAVNKAQFNSLLTNLAFVIAKQNDPGGRISGADFDAAVRQIAMDADDPATLNRVITNLGNKFIEGYRRDVEDYSQLEGAKQLDLLRNVRGFEEFEKRQRQRALPSDAQSVFENYQNAKPNDLINIGGINMTRSNLEQMAVEESMSVDQLIKTVMELQKEQGNNDG